MDCPAEGCSRPTFARGFCRSHYQRWRRENGKPCSVPGCHRHVASHNLCDTHVWRMKRWGTTEDLPYSLRPAALARPSLDEQVRSRIESGAPDECWEWTGNRNPHGYGMLYVGGSLPGPKMWLAHRVVMVLAGELEPDDKSPVCHTCDNRACCNEAHLYVGTPQSNTADMMARGRNRPLRGEQNGGGGKLTAEQVKYIKAQHRVVRQQELAEQFGVSLSLISKIHGGRAWRHIDD